MLHHGQGSHCREAEWVYIPSLSTTVHHLLVLCADQMMKRSERSTASYMIWEWLQNDLARVLLDQLE